MEAPQALGKSAFEFVGRVFHRWYVLLPGVVCGLLGAYELVGGGIKLPPWLAWGIFGGSLFTAVFWAFHDLRVERDGLRMSEKEPLDSRYDALSDLLGAALKAGLELSEEGDWPVRQAWVAWTRSLVAAAYGDGEAAHVFTPTLGGQRVYVGLEMRNAPPPLAEPINRVRELLGRMPTLSIRPDFKPVAWSAFDPEAYRAEFARASSEDAQGLWICPWCDWETEYTNTSTCENCNAERAGDHVYRAAA